MAQATERITFTVPKELADRINEAAKSESCSRSEFLRKAVDKHMRDLRWQRRYRYTESQAETIGITPEEVDDIVHEVRDEMWRERQSQS